MKLTEPFLDELNHCAEDILAVLTVDLSLFASTVPQQTVFHFLVQLASQSLKSLTFGLIMTQDYVPCLGYPLTVPNRKFNKVRCLNINYRHKDLSYKC